MSLQDAREAREDARRLLTRGIDPDLEKKVKKLATKHSVANTFGAVAGEYFAKRDRETAGDPLNPLASDGLPDATVVAGFRWKLNGTKGRRSRDLVQRH